MKRIALVTCVLCSALVGMADRYMFSPDGVKAGSGLRELPSQGVELSTGKVVIGLHALGDERRMACGWYRYVANPKPDTNHYYRVSGYSFTPTGTVEAVWAEYTPKARVAKYSKLKILEKLTEMGRWADVKAVLEANGYIDYWNACTYIEAGNERFVALKSALADVLVVTEKELDDLLATCLY